MVSLLRDELKYLSLPRGDICIAKDDIDNLLSMRKTGERKIPGANGF